MQPKVQSFSTLPGYKMKIILVIAFGCVLSASCGRNTSPENDTFEQRDRRELNLFRGEEVAEHTVAVLTGKPESDLEVLSVKDVFYVTSRSGFDSGEQFVLKIGDGGIMLFRGSDEVWTNRVMNRRVVYFEEKDRLVLSELFEGESSSYFEFIKQTP